MTKAVIIPTPGPSSPLPRYRAVSGAASATARALSILHRFLYCSILCRVSYALSFIYYVLLYDFKLDWFASRCKQNISCVMASFPGAPEHAHGPDTIYQTSRGVTRHVKRMVTRPGRTVTRGLVVGLYSILYTLTNGLHYRTDSFETI